MNRLVYKKQKNSCNQVANDSRINIFCVVSNNIVGAKGGGRKYYRIAPFAHIEGKKKNFGVGGKNICLERKTNSFYEQEKSKKREALYTYLFD